MWIILKNQFLSVYFRTEPLISDVQITSNVKENDPQVIRNFISRFVVWNQLDLKMTCKVIHWNIRKVCVTRSSKEISLINVINNKESAWCTLLTSSWRYCLFRMSEFHSDIQPNNRNHCSFLPDKSHEDLATLGFLWTFYCYAVSTRMEKDKGCELNGLCSVSKKVCLFCRISGSSDI